MDKCLSSGCLYLSFLVFFSLLGRYFSSTQTKSPRYFVGFLLEFSYFPLAEYMFSYSRLSIWKVGFRHFVPRTRRSHPLAPQNLAVPALAPLAASTTGKLPFPRPPSRVRIPHPVSNRNFSLVCGRNFYAEGSGRC